MKEYRGCVWACLLVMLWGCRGLMECKGTWRRVGCGACFLVEVWGCKGREEV